MNDHAAEARTLLDPDTISAEEHDAAHASQSRVKLVGDERVQYGTAIVTDDHRVVVELESGDLYAMQLTATAAERLREDLERMMLVELDPPNTGEGVAVRVDASPPFEFPPPASHPLEPEVADWHRRFREPLLVVAPEALDGLVGKPATAGPAEGTVLAEVKGQPAAAHLIEDGGTVAGLRLRVRHGSDVYETGDPEVDALVAEGLAGLPADWQDKGRAHGPMLAGIARMIIAHTPPTERYREIPGDPEMQRRVDDLRASMGNTASIFGQAEVDNLRRASLVPLDVQIAGALRLVAEARAGEGDAACRACGHPVVQRRLASIQAALEAMRTGPGEVAPGGSGPAVRPLQGATNARAVLEIEHALRAAHILPTIGGVTLREVVAGVDTLCREHADRGNVEERDLVIRQLVRAAQRMRGHLGDANYLEAAIRELEVMALPYVERADVAHDAAAAVRRDKPGFTADDPRLDGAAVDTRFTDLFYLPGGRVALRFAGILCPLALPPTEARRLALAINTEGASLLDVAEDIPGQIESPENRERRLLAGAVNRILRREGVDIGHVQKDNAGCQEPARLYRLLIELADQRRAFNPPGQRLILMGPEPADNIRIKIRLDWQDPEADMYRMFAATEGARGALVSRQRVAEPEPTVELVLPFEAYGLLTDTPGLHEKLRAEFPFVVAVLERGLPERSRDAVAEAQEVAAAALAELQTIAERVGPVIGEGQIATQDRRPGEVARAVRTLADLAEIRRLNADEADAAREAMRRRLAAAEGAAS